MTVEAESTASLSVRESATKAQERQRPCVCTMMSFCPVIYSVTAEGFTLLVHTFVFTRTLLLLLLDGK